MPANPDRIAGRRPAGVGPIRNWGKGVQVSVWSPAAVLVMVLLLAGCAHGPIQNPSQQHAVCTGDPIAACTRQPARYPAWAVALADPIAPLVGRTIALVRLRPGHLAGDETAKRLLLSEVEPLDVILVSSKGRLSGNAVPGHFTHTIITIGSEEQLRQLGVWSRPSAEPHQDAIRRGKIFVEADYKGVHLSSAERILDTDRLLVLRPKNRSRTWLRKSACSLLSHIGSRFDFRFDAGEDHRLYCSELAFHALPELKLPVRRLYNRDVVLPDDVAATGLEPGTSLSFVLYLRGGPQGWTSESRRVAIADLARTWRK